VMLLFERFLGFLPAPASPCKPDFLKESLQVSVYVITWQFGFA
jgi:hypothetical protein